MNVQEFVLVILVHETVYWQCKCSQYVEANATQWDILEGILWKKDSLKAPPSHSTLLFEVRHKYLKMLVWKDQG